ncbi:GtrA family protein [Dechloromonas sp. H13]|uniref:GtrA family protein n=1 Tax=Dechloromonas sp. H13 TaxID=2570193 RepID=UPI00129189B6|nr:GtrA family protein [Dechloromonas sp. H13]
MAGEVFNIKTRESVTQLFRYALVGLLSNVAGYLVYLAFTYVGGTPKVTMTLLYGVGAAVGFFGNRSLTFEHQGSIMGAGVRYVIAHCIGYLLNLGILIVFVDKLGHPHQWVQGVAIFVVAAFLFLAFKVFVFPDSREVAR